MQQMAWAQYKDLHRKLDDIVAAHQELYKKINETRDCLTVLEVNKQLEIKLDHMLRAQEIDMRLKTVEKDMKKSSRMLQAMFLIP